MHNAEDHAVKLWCTSCKQDGQKVRLQPSSWFQKLKSCSASNWEPPPHNLGREKPSVLNTKVEGRVFLTTKELKRQLHFFPFPSALHPEEVDKTFSTVADQVLSQFEDGGYPVVNMVADYLDKDIGAW